VTSYVGRGAFTDGRDRFWRVGGDVDLFVRDLNVFAVVMHGRDDLTALGSTGAFDAATVEAHYVAKPWVVPILRFDTVMREAAPDIRRVVPGIALAIRANVRVVAEWEAFLKTSFAGVREARGDSRARIRLDLVF
jgi:hypothetical protein